MMTGAVLRATVKPRWLDRRIAAPAQFLTLCLNVDEFAAACKHLRVPAPPFLATEHANATAHFFTCARGRAVVVCLGDCSTRSAVEIAGLLVHEAVHVWQDYAEGIGEHAPGAEQEAYAIQSIAQELMAEFARRVE